MLILGAGKPCAGRGALGSAHATHHCGVDKNNRRSIERLAVMHDGAQQELMEEVQKAQIEGTIMALTIAAAEHDANPPQKKMLAQHIPRLVRQYRHTGDTKPVLNYVSKVMFRAWKPSGEFADHIDRLRQ